MNFPAEWETVWILISWLYTDLHCFQNQLYQGSAWYGSSLDKQRICINTQLKSSKKQLKLNMCVPKINSVDQLAIACDVIAYHLVHFISIWVINKCQSGIKLFFLLASAPYNSNFMNKISASSQVF